MAALNTRPRRRPTEKVPPRTERAGQKERPPRSGRVPGHGGRVVNSENQPGVDQEAGMTAMVCVSCVDLLSGEMIIRPFAGDCAHSALLIDTVSVAEAPGATESNWPVLIAEVNGLNTALPATTSPIDESSRLDD